MPESPNDFRSVAVVGSGALGAEIARLIGASGREVHTVPEDGPVPAAVDLVVEAVEDADTAKRAVLAAVAAAVGEDVPVVTTTAVLSVTDLASGLPNPGRVAGLHFVGAPTSFGTVEVVRALQTEDELSERLLTLGESLGLVPVPVPDRPGFLVNAMLLPYLNDVIQEFDDGLATAADIDVALELGLGYKTGPLALLDRIGLDVHLRTTEAVHAATADARYAPPPLLRRMVAAGRLGDRSGGGFRTAPSNQENN